MMTAKLRRMAQWGVYTVTLGAISLFAYAFGLRDDMSFTRTNLHTDTASADYTTCTSVDTPACASCGGGGGDDDDGGGGGCSGGCSGGGDGDDGGDS